MWCCVSKMPNDQGLFLAAFDRSFSVGRQMFFGSRGGFTIQEEIRVSEVYELDPLFYNAAAQNAPAGDVIYWRLVKPVEE